MKLERIMGTLALLAFAGCSSYTEIAKWDPSVKVNDGETPIASFETRNHSYQLLYCIPLCTGVPWTAGSGPVKDDYDVELFSDMATVEDNMKSLRHALNVTGSHRVAQLRTTMYDSAFWSLFIVNRHEVRTYCQILPPAPPAKGN